jgi:acyl-CoA synthetase (AMP-forming)/AMP-acid ligase II
VAGTSCAYWNQPEQTAQALRGGWPHTGDGGYMDGAGYVHIVDRIKDMIVTGGENVYSAEVENALATHHAVASCAVIGVPDDKWGERVRAVVVLREDRHATAEELGEHVRTRIAGYDLGVPAGYALAAAHPRTSGHGWMGPLWT